MKRKVEGEEDDTGGRYRVGMDIGAISNTSMHFSIPDPSHAQRSHFGFANFDWGKISK
jgi:hypothetical protein